MLNNSLDVYDKVNATATAQKYAGSPFAFRGQESVNSLAKTDAANKPALIDEAALSKAVKMLNEHVAPALQSVEFSIDQETNRTIVKVVDTATHKVLRQIPNEEVIAMSKTLGKLQGLMIKQTA
ncbi:MAG TPA: flagellar protein FlaG [Methylotenera sp.]|nr:flagellar protein FlaG [Methylotenera sp.]HPH04987.1 flagellar protein FlaG [Methylotenera sp.]HPN00249.1 flagellar protein FlaG [Methylotenera sp.]